MVFSDTKLRRLVNINLSLSKSNINNMNDQILIIGGTGTTGRSLVELLKSSDANYKVMVRNYAKAAPLQAEGVSTVMGELGDWPVIESILNDIDTVFLLSSPSPTKVEEQNGLIDQAVKAGVRKIVKISAVIADVGSHIHLADWHGTIENHLIASGLDYIILRPHSFMQNMLMHLGSIKGQNSIYESMGTAKIPMIDTRDVAQASFDCLIRNNLNNNTYVITGPEAISYDDVANALSKATGRQINYIPVPSEAHNQGMKTAGLPDWLADDLTFMSKNWGQKEVHQPTSDFKKISRTQQYDIDRFAKDYAGYF